MSWQSEVRAWALAGAGAFALSAIGYRVLTLPKVPDLNGTVSNINAATGAWAKASDQQVKSVTAIERDLRAEMWHLDRTLGTVDGTLQTAQGTLGAVTVAVGTANTQIARVGPLLDSARGATEAIQSTVASAQPVMDSTATAVKHLDALVSDPAIPKTLDHTEKITGDAQRITKDAADEADKLAHPPLKKLGFWGTVDAVIAWAHSHLVPPIF